MIYPSVDKILNIIGSKYELVYVAAIRSEQMNENKHFQMKESEYKSKKGIGRALEEIEKGLVKIKKDE